MKGAQPWVGRAAYNFGSFYLWGDLPALMPVIHRRKDYRKGPGESWNPERPSFTTDKAWKSLATEGVKVPGLNWSDRSRRGQAFNPAAQGKAVREGRKGAGAGAEWFDQNLCQLSSRSEARKAASAKIAKIPLALSSHIARVYKPKAEAA